MPSVYLSNFSFPKCYFDTFVFVYKYWMYAIEVKTLEDANKFIEVLEEQPVINKVSTEGIVRDNNIKTMLFGAFYSANVISFILYDDLHKIVGIASSSIASTGQFWYVNYGYTTVYGRETYGSLPINVEAYLVGWKIARERNCHEMYAVTRTSKARLIKKFFSESDSLLSSLSFEIVETIDPFKLSINPLVNTVLLGVTAGRTPKKMSVIRMYDPEKVKYAYPYARKN